MQIKWYTSKFFTILLQYIIHPRIILLHEPGYILYMTTMVLTAEKFFRQIDCCFVCRWATVY
jgi:hypothetical protein